MIPNVYNSVSKKKHTHQKKKKNVHKDQYELCFSVTYKGDTWFLSPDGILCGWLDSKHQLTN